MTREGLTLRLPNPLAAAAGLAFLVPGGALGGDLDALFACAVALAGAFALWTRPSPWETRRPARQAAFFFGLLQVAALVSYAYSAAFNGGETGPRDWEALGRPALMGLLAAALLRHSGRDVRAAAEAGMTASLYVSWAYLPPQEYAYVAAMGLCWLLFFSRTKLRYLHAAAALALLLRAGWRPAWTAACLALAAAAAVELRARLAARRSARPALLSWALFAALLAAGAAWTRAGAPEAAAPAKRSAALELARRSPVFGWGPARYESLPDEASQYELWLARGGALGAALCLGGLAWSARGLAAAARGDLRRRAGAWALAACLALLLGAGPFLDSFRLFLATALLVVTARPEPTA